MVGHAEGGEDAAWRVGEQLVDRVPLVILYHLHAQLVQAKPHTEREAGEDEAGDDAGACQNLGMKEMNEPAQVSTARSLPLYVGAGGIATASHYAFTLTAVEGLAWPPLLASIGGFGIGAAIKYWLNYRLTFRSREKHLEAAPRFAGTLLLLLVANAAVFALLHELLGLHYIPAQVLTTAILIVPGYLASRYWVFARC